MGKDAEPATAKPPVLEVEDLQTHFFSREGVVKAVDGVSFQVARGETLGIAGESGCGKSVTMQSILRIVPSHGKIVGGAMRLARKNGEQVDLAALDPSGRTIRDIRGAEISMVFQEPMTSFSPVHTIGNQIMEAITLHQQVDKLEARRRAQDILRLVGMPKVEETIDAYPFNLSGGMRQRAMIAMALSCQPSVLIADEPTTAVDVTIQAVILKLIKRLQAELDMALIVITHDLAVIAELADRVMIMYLGKDVEYAPVDDLFYAPKHPYTRGLLDSIPKLGHGERHRQKLVPIEGSVPNPFETPAGCPFHPRCSEAMPGVCDTRVPATYRVGDQHTVSCFLYEGKE